MVQQQLMEADFRQILRQVQYKEWKFHLGQDGARFYLQVHFYARCSVSGKFEPQRGRKWALSKHMTPSEVVTTALKAVLTAEEHEARENFTYRSQAVFGPHLDVDVLAELLETRGLEVLDGRAPMESAAMAGGLA
jgi:hypothetical protein